MSLGAFAPRKVPNILPDSHCCSSGSVSGQAALGIFYSGSRSPRRGSTRGRGRWSGGMARHGRGDTEESLHPGTHIPFMLAAGQQQSHLHAGRSVSFGARTGRDKGTKWGSGLPGRDDGRGLRVWKVSGQGGAGLLMHSFFGWALGWNPERGQAGWARNRDPTEGHPRVPGSDQRVVELATLERLLVVGPGRGGHAAVGV